MSNDKNIVMYGKTGCEYCVKAHALLRIKELPYTYTAIDTSTALRDEVIELWKSVGIDKPTLPLIVINDKVIGGYNELEQLALSNNL